MKPNVYKIYDVNIPETFKRIDSFLGEDTMDLIENQPILNENNIKTIKMLISDLTVLDGLKPKELKKREQQVFKINIHVKSVLPLTNGRNRCYEQLFFNS